MPFTMQPKRMYRMPTFFGPSCGPREGPNGRKFANVDTPKGVAWSVRFLTNRKQLEDLIPEGLGLSLVDEPVVNVTFSVGTELEWLAGRGYNTFGVTFPARFDGKIDHVQGELMVVLWENMTDPILTGREELGFSKIYAELPEPRFLNGGAHLTASWMGFRFADMRLSSLHEPTEEELKGMSQLFTGEGLLHHKYIPKTGEWGTPEVSCVTFLPFAGGNGRSLELKLGDGTIEWHKATWEDMPTQYHIVNALAALEVKEWRGAMMVREVGGKDLSDQRVVR